MHVITHCDACRTSHMTYQSEKEDETSTQSVSTTHSRALRSRVSFAAMW